jgi:hypothetical protein
MLATIVSIIIAIYLFVNPYLITDVGNTLNITLIMLIIGSLLLPVAAMMTAIAFIPLQRTEEKSIPRLLELFFKDKHIQLTTIWLFLTPILVTLLCFEENAANLITRSVTLGIWVLTLGISADAIHHYLKRISLYLNPYSAIELFTEDARESIRSDRDVKLLGDIDVIAETGLRAANKDLSSLCNHCLNELQIIAKHFMISQKSVSHIEEDPEMKAMGVKDTVSFTLYYLIQRIEMIFDRGLSKKLEPLCSNVITHIGKIALSSAQVDLTLTSYPILVLGKLAKTAQQQGLVDVGVKATLVVQEVAKRIVEECDLSYAELQEPFFSIINTLKILADETFRQDKTTSIPILIKPFQDLKTLFQGETLANHKDTPAIIGEIDRVLAEFETLKEVMSTIPTIPNVG